MAKKNNTKTEKVVAAPAPVAPKSQPVVAPKVQLRAVEPVANQPASDETRPNRTPTHEEISKRAFELWTMRGGIGGNAQEDWFRAEQELRARR
jgi:hypothetical protein